MWVTKISNHHIFTIVSAQPSLICIKTERPKVWTCIMIARKFETVEQQECLILDGLMLFVHNPRMFAFLLSLCCYPQDSSLI